MPFFNRAVRFVVPALALSMLLLLHAGCSEGDDLLQVQDAGAKWHEGDLTGALTELEGIVESNPDNEYAWTLIGHVRTSMDQDSIAMEAYNRALSINDSVEEAITGQGVIYRRWGRIDDAAERYTRAIAINPNYAQAHSSMMVIDLLRGKYLDAVVTGTRAYSLDSTDPAIVANLSLAYHFMGDTVKRNLYYEKAAQMDYQSLDNLQKVFSGEYTLFPASDTAGAEVPSDDSTRSDIDSE